MSRTAGRALDVEGRRILVRGTVQGVGFRPWVYRLAVEQGLSRAGAQRRAGGDDRGVRGAEALDAFRSPARDRGAPGRAGRRRARRADPRRAHHGLRDRPERRRGDRRVSIPPDLATCPECLREVADPSDRRHFYPFTNCTHCGPRYTIARDVPYDRPATTMADFAMCPDCRREYEDPLDRRFHAQPIACPACGPRLRAVDAAGQPEGDEGDAIAAAAADLGAGRIVAVKGLGRLPPRVRRHVGRGRRAAPRAQAAGREAVRGHGARPRGGAGAGAARRRRGGPARLGRAPDRPRAAASRRRPRPRGRARAIRSSAWSSPTRRCTTSSCRPWGGRW